jgi:hypothetical protein
MEEHEEIPGCPHCGAPIGKGHMPECPFNASRKPQKYNGRTGPITNHRFELPRDPELLDKIDGLQNGFYDFQLEAPGVLALTLQGSMVHGYGTAESDFDGSIYIDMDEAARAFPRAKITTEHFKQDLYNYSVTKFDRDTMGDYLDVFEECVRSNAPEIEEEDMDHIYVFPIGHKIIDFHIEEFMRFIDEVEKYFVARKAYEEATLAGESGLAEPDYPEYWIISPLLLSLFCLEIGHGIDEYRKYFLDALQKDERGEAFWYRLAEELESHEQWEETNTAKYYPRTLKQARDLYIRD